MDSREERQKRVDEAFHSSGFGMPYVAPSPLQQEADAAASLVNVKPAAPAPSMWEQVRDSAIGRSYFWGKEDYSRRSREIAERLQISPDMVSVAGEESLKRWEETFRVLDMGERDSEFANTWSDWNDISQTERAIRVHNYADIKQTMGVVDNITSGVRQMDALIQMSALGNERMELEAKGADTEELDAKIQNLQQYIVSQAGNGGIIHETASQLYMMGHQSVHSGKETMIGAFTGAMAGAAGGSVFGGIGALPGAEAGFKTGAYYGYRMGMFNRANEMERGLSYLDYRTGSQYGKLTAEQAAVAAPVTGALNAVIEFASFGMGMRALSLGARAITGKAAATGAQSIIRNAARAVASAQSVGGAAKLFGKAAGIGVVSETAEEVAQQAVSDIVWNVAADPSTGSRPKPVTEIIGNAVDAGIAAVPAILGMSAVLGAGANVRFVAKAARMLRPDYEIQKELAVHSIGTQMLRDLEADKQASKLFQKDPALYTRSVQEAADKQGLGAFFVDAHALMETEQGRNILNRMVSGKVVSEEALQTAIETEGRLEVPVGVYLQEDFTEQERGAVDQASAWTKDGATPAEMTAHWENMAASKYAQELQDDIDRMVQAAERVLEEYFPTSNEADKETIRRVLMANPLDLTAARKAVRKELIDYIETEFSGTLREMREDKKDGTVFIATIQESGARGPYSTRRISTNPGWYRDFYKEHKRPPRVNEFYEIMLDWEEDSATGVAKSEEERSEIQAWVNTGRQALDSLYTIEAFSDTFDELQKENAISLRMHLSADEMKVYDAVKAYMESVGGDAADSAQQAAYLWAKRAKVFAQMMRDMGHADFVATDYLDMHPLFAMDEYTPDAADQMAAQLMQAMYSSSAKNLSEFVQLVMDGSTSKAYYRVGEGANAVDIPHSTVKHIQNGKHPLSPEEWQMLEKHILHVQLAGVSKRPISAHTKGVLAKVVTPQYAFGVVLKFTLNGRAFLDTAFINTEHGIDAWIKEKSAHVLAGSSPGSVSHSFLISKIHDLLMKVKGDDGTAYFQAEKQPLVALHNTDARKIRHIAKMQGIAVPSIGIARADIPYESFGDISLIGDTQLIDPADKENPTYDADAYSPRYPSIYGYRVAKKEAAKFAADMVSLAKRFDEKRRYSAHEIEGAVKVGTENSPTGNGLLGVEGVQHAWLADIGKRKSDFADDSAAYYYVRDHRQDLLAWVEERFDAVEKTPLFFDGYTPSGRRRLKEYTLENIVKKLKGKAKNTEGMVYGVGNVRAKHAKQYKKLAAIQADRERIVSPKEAKEAKAELTERYFALTSKYGSAIENILLNVSPKNWQSALDEAQITDITAEDLRRFVTDVVQAPTEYFEVKKQRAVGLNEFRAAVVPKDTPADVREILADAGLKVVDYAEGERSQVLWNVAQELQGKYGNILFQRRQNQKRRVRGMTALRDGRQMLFLFRNDANFSTFVHESGHVFLEDLRLMAEQEQAPAWLKTDWETVKEWAGWNDADGADNRAAHEKWARGFEAYVREGKAPSRDLKAVFRRFRRWLVGIYQNLLDLGEVPPESIRNVMDRMLATQEEIDAYTAEQALDSMQEVDAKLAERLTKLKARAAEAVEKKVEATVRKGAEELLEETIRLWRTARTDELRKEDVYKHEALAKQFGEGILDKYYPDTAAFERALAEAGGSLEERLQREEQEQRQVFTNELMSPDVIRAQVESYMTGEAGQADLLEAETRYIARERNKLAGEYMKQLRKLNDNPQRGNPKRRLHPGELPESPTREELLAKPDVQVVDAALPENSPLVPSAELLAAQQARDEAYAAGKRGKDLPDNPYWKEYRARIKSWLKEHVPEQVAHPELGLIQIPRKGIDHATASARSAEALAVLGNLEQILANGVLTQYQTDRHGDGRVHGVWIMHTPVYYQGQTLVVRSVLKKRSDGAFYYDAQTTKIEATIGLKPAGEYNSSVTDTSIVASSAISVEEMLKHVKSEDQPLADGYLTEAERLAEVLSYLRSELKGHEGARESVIDAQKQLSKIRQNERAAERELEREQTLVKQLKENHAEDAEEHAQKLAEMRQKLTDMRKENAAKVQAIKKTAREEINKRLQGLRDVRDSTQGRLRLIEERAAQTLRQAPIGESLTWKTYQRKIAYYGTLSAKALVRGDYPKAAEMKERQLYHAYLAKHAVMQERQVDKDIRRLRENLKRITRSQQPVRLDTQSRYFVHHLMYQLGLTGTDAQLPTDGFTWSAIEALLNPDAAFGMGGEPVISDALRGMFATDARNEKAWRQMPYEEWEQTARILQAVYTAGRRMHDGLAIVRKSGDRVSIETAATELSAKLRARYGEDSRDLRQIRNDMTRADRMGELAGELVAQLIKPEVILNRLDGRAVGVKIEDDSFHRFIYDPIARAANRRREMTAEAKRALSRIFERRYSRNELRTMRQKRMYQIGNRRLYTKEEILTAALNWGAIENRKRVLHTFGVDERTMEGELGRILTAKDWDTVEKIWQFIDGYYEERSRILERETGVPLGKVEAVSFTINGRKFDGGYYPIVYDPQLSQKASDMDVANELAKQMSSNAVFGAGLGATKQRRAVVNRELLLSLDVLPRAVNEAILHISMREAVLDVAHLLDHAALAEPLQKVIGQSQYRMLREWVRDTWREELVRESSAEQFANLLRRNATFSVMAYRTTTALLNICNLDMVYQSLGHRRTWLALLKFIRHPQRIARKVKEKSSFIAEREENLDRDLARDMKVSGKELSYAGTQGVAAKAAEGVYSAKEAVNRFGYYLITKTDLMLSLPTWQAVYEDTVRAEMERGELTAEQIDAEAIAKADEAVRRIWGSGEIQDQSKVQKGRIMKFFTPFYTFFSVVLNAHIEAGYALKDNGNPVPLMSTVLYWLFLQVLRETLLRGGIDALTGRGPDDDDDWLEYFGKEYAKNFVGTATGGIPGVNIAATLTMNTMLGEYYQGRGSQVVALRVMDELQDLAYAVGSDKRDWVDMGRSASRVGNRLVGFSDTLTDGFWTLLRVTCTESDATWDEAVADIIFDRKARKAQ
ncbi:MAG: hypothetical protein MR209_00045 [Veillonellaceae bacterium]|nr:hypothetical protein [Veillonellaceae bacterium]